MTWANTTLTDFEAAVKSSDPTPGGRYGCRSCSWSSRGAPLNGG